MSINANSNKYLGVGKRFIIPGVPHVPVTCPFVNAQAQTYWNALTVANGGVEVDGSIYGISTCQLKQAIDTWFIDITIAGGAFAAVYPYIGGTAATHAINAVNPGTYNLLFTGGTHTAQGTNFDGLSAFADTQYLASSLLPGDMHISARYTRFAGTFTPGTIIGSSNGIGPGSDECYIDFIPLTTSLSSALYTNGSLTSEISYTPASSTAFTIAARPSSSSMILTQNSVIVNSASGPYAGTPPAYSIYISAKNQGIFGAQRFVKTRMSFNSIGKYMNEASLTTITNVLNTTLSR
jgi:hypothetical protein